MVVQIVTVNPEKIQGLTTGDGVVLEGVDDEPPSKFFGLNFSIPYVLGSKLPLFPYNREWSSTQ